MKITLANCQFLETLYMKQIFLGNGEYSGKEVQNLHNLLNEAIELLGGLQQPPMSTDKPNCQDGRWMYRAEVRLREIVSEISVKLTGEDVRFIG